MTTTKNNITDNIMKGGKKQTFQNPKYPYNFISLEALQKRLKNTLIINKPNKKNPFYGELKNKYTKQLKPNAFYTKEQTLDLLKQLKNAGYTWDWKKMKVVKQVIKQRIITTYVEGKRLGRSDLLVELVRDYGIRGNYKVQIFRGSNNLADHNEKITLQDEYRSWWDYAFKKYEIGGYGGVMVWNAGMKGDIRDFDDLGNRTYNELGKIEFKFSLIKKLDYKKVNQKFLDGETHCVLNPIVEWAKYMYDKSSSGATKKKYNTYLNAIYGKNPKRGTKTIGFLEKFADGVGEDEFQEICDTLLIDVEVELPFQQKIYLECKAKNRKRKTFRYVNSRLNHLTLNENNKRFDVVYHKDYDNSIELSPEEIKDKLKELKENDEFCYYQKGKYGVNLINTTDTLYTIPKSEFDEEVERFERETMLKYCKIDAVKFPQLSKFLQYGTHYQGTIDYKPELVKVLRGDMTKTMFINKEEIDDIRNNTKHIDQEKAYAQSKECKFYSGFVGKITDFRKTSDYQAKGLYYITNTSLDKCKSKVRKHLETLGWIEDGNIYTDAELKFFKHYGVEFVVEYGAFGTQLDFEFTDKMKYNKQDVGEDLKPIPFYSLYTGKLGSMKSDKQFYMNGRREYFSNMMKLDNDIWYCDEEQEASITKKKHKIIHATHITAQITAYQRINMMEQLLKMDYDKIIRVVVDGIYYQDHEFNLKNTFRMKDDRTFSNGASKAYLSSLLDKDYIKDSGVLPVETEPREFFKRELFIGAGGNGKTQFNLTDKGLVDILFVSPSWKLSSSKYKEFPSLSANNVLHNLVNQPYSKEIINKYSVIIVDEASMITEFEKQFIMRNSMSKLIFCGDISYQLEPIITDLTRIQYIKKLEAEMREYDILLNGNLSNEPIQQPDRRNLVERQLKVCEYITKNVDDYMNEMNSNGFNNVVELTKNYRYGDDKVLSETIKYLRQMILKKKGFSEAFNHIKDRFENVGIEDLKQQYIKEDTILCSEHIYKDYYTHMFKDIEKYRVKSNTRDYKNGEILYEKEDGVKMELTHGLTSHSIQGITCENVVYIDIRKQKSIRMLHTCIGRARRNSQIKFIIDDTEIVNKKYEKSVIYKIYNPDCDDIYIGSTCEFKKRINSHKKVCNELNHKNYNVKLYKFIRDNGGIDAWKFEVLEEVSVNNHPELHKIEQDYIDTMRPQLNSANPYRKD